MNNQTRTRSLVPPLALGLALAGAGPAVADVPTGQFQDEIRRCVDQIRTGLDDGNVHRYRFEVSRADRTAGWYVFRIETTALDREGRLLAAPRQDRCAASRWDSRVTVEAVKESPGSSAALIQAARSAPAATAVAARP